MYESVALFWTTCNAFRDVGFAAGHAELRENGWEEYAPFDAIIVTCAPDHVPQPLTRQLKDGGRLVIPVGPPGFYQTLWLIVREGEQFKLINLSGVRFVPMLGEH